MFDASIYVSLHEDVETSHAAAIDEMTYRYGRQRAGLLRLRPTGARRGDLSEFVDAGANYHPRADHGPASGVGIDGSILTTLQAAEPGKVL